MNLRWSQHGRVDGSVHSGPPGQNPSRHRQRETASALLVVIVLMAVLATIAVSNSLVLRHLKRELNLIELKHRKRLAAPSAPRPAASTNLVQPRKQ